MKRVREPTSEMLSAVLDGWDYDDAEDYETARVDLHATLRRALSAVDLVDAREAEAEVERLERFVKQWEDRFDRWQTWRAYEAMDAALSQQPREDASEGEDDAC